MVRATLLILLLALFMGLSTPNVAAPSTPKLPLIMRDVPGQDARAQQAQPLAGFGRFPGVCGSSLLVSVETTGPAEVKAAATLTMLMRKLSGCALEARIVPWEEALKEQSPALLIAASPASTTELDPLLDGESLVFTAAQGAALHIQPGASFAVLQAYTTHGRDVLLLTHRNDPSGKLLRALVEQVSSAPERWSALDGNLLLQTSDGPPQVFWARNVPAEHMSADANPWLTIRPLVYLLGLGLIGFFMWRTYPRVVRECPGQLGIDPRSRP